MEDNTQKSISLIGRRKYKINDDISVYIPTLREVRGDSDKDEIEYHHLINLFMVTSTNYMVELDSIGINFETISDWQLFVMLYNSLNGKNLFLLFGIDVVCEFEIYADKSNTDNFFIMDSKSGIKITKEIYEQISNVICKINNVTKEHRVFSNEFSRKHAIERLIKVSKRNKEKGNNTSNLFFDNCITAMVCTANFPYNYETILDITLHDFIASIKQIKKKYSVDNYYLGIYTGNIDINKSKISQKDLDWFVT